MVDEAREVDAELQDLAELQAWVQRLGEDVGVAVALFTAIYKPPPAPAGGQSGSRDGDSDTPAEPPGAADGLESSSESETTPVAGDGPADVAEPAAEAAEVQADGADEQVAVPGAPGAEDAGVEGVDAEASPSSEGSAPTEASAPPHEPAPGSALLAGALNYLFKSAELLPDGVEDLRALDCACVLRVACEQLLDLLGSASGAELADVRNLASGTGLLRDFLGTVYPHLANYVGAQQSASARGRAVDEILGDEAVAAEFVAEVRAFAESYRAPSFLQDRRNVGRIQAFFEAKLVR